MGGGKGERGEGRGTKKVQWLQYVGMILPQILYKYCILTNLLPIAVPLSPACGFEVNDNQIWEYLIWKVESQKLWKLNEMSLIQAENQKRSCVLKDLLDVRGFFCPVDGWLRFLTNPNCLFCYGRHHPISFVTPCHCEYYSLYFYVHGSVKNHV